MILKRKLEIRHGDLRIENFNWVFLVGWWFIVVARSNSNISFHPKQRCCSLWHFTSDRHENVLLNLIPKVTSFSSFRIRIGCRYIFWSIHLNERKWWKHLWIEPMEALLDRTNGSTFYFSLTSRGDEIVCAHSSWSSNSAEILTQLSNKGPNFCSSGPFLFYNG